MEAGREAAAAENREHHAWLARLLRCKRSPDGAGVVYSVIGERGCRERVRLFARQLHPLAQQAQRLHQPGHRVHARRLVGERHGEGGGGADANVAAAYLRRRRFQPKINS